MYVRNSPSLLANTKSFGPINDLPVVRCCTQRDFFHSSRVVFSMLGIGTSRTLAAVLVSEITVRWSTILPSELRTGNSVTAESIEMMPLSKSTCFHFSASASPMRNPANICIIHSAFMKSFFEMTSRKYSRISIGIALYVSCLRSLCSGVDLTMHSDTGL